MPYDERKHSYRDDRVAGHYDARRFDGRSGSRKHGHDARLIADILRGVAGPAWALDAPTGTGRLLPTLAHEGRRALGMDVSEEMLKSGWVPVQGVEASNEPPHGGFPRVAGDLEHAPFRSNAFAAVLCYRFFFHVDQAAVRLRILRELARICTGPILLQERNADSLKQRSRRARVALGWRAPRPVPTRRELHEEIVAAGLDVERCIHVSRLFSDKLIFVLRRAE